MALKLKERTYRRVPIDSIIEIKTSPVTGSGYTLNGRVDQSGSKKKSWTHAQLKNKIVKYTLKASGTSIARIAAAFSSAGNSSVKVRVKIIRPDKKQHSKTWNASLFGKNGDVARAKIRVRVR